MNDAAGDIAAEIAAEIAAVIAAEIVTPAPAPFQALAEAVRRRHEPASLAVLFYGNCLRSREDRDQVADLYLIVDAYRAAYRSRWLAAANRMLPPNVFYIEVPYEDRVVRAKYAVVSLPQLERLVAPRTLQASFWARFAQPMRLLWARDHESRRRLVATLARAVATTAGETRALVDRPEALFARAFRESYASELRAEGAERADALYQFDRDRYDGMAALLAKGGPACAADGAPARRRAVRRWRLRRLVGKGLSVLRLLKGAFTFKDGASYLLWKIERHSGVRHDLTPWQRRHPILASSVLFWQLYRKGAFR